MTGALRTHEIEETMTRHNIDCDVKKDANGVAWGKIMVAEVSTEDGKTYINWINATSWTAKQVKIFLGY